MKAGSGPLPIEARIEALAARIGVPLTPETIAGLARHARAVLGAPRTLHLTSIDDASEFIERQVGEALQGAALMDPAASGVLLDLGSGNGYPGIPIGFVRPSLKTVLVESSSRRAAFLRDLGHARPAGSEVLERQVQRAADLEDISPVRVLVTRAMGGWERIVPRLRSTLVADADVLLWAGETTEAIARRAAWRGFELRSRHLLEGRERSWIWRFSVRSSAS